MRKVIEWIEAVMKVLTIVASIFTIVEVVNAWLYRRKLARKAQDYLEDEFIPETNIGSTINVYSPTVKSNRNKVKTLLAVTGAGCVGLVVINLLKIRRD